MRLRLRLSRAFFYLRNIFRKESEYMSYPVDFRILACCGVKELNALAGQRSMPAVIRQVEATFVNPTTRPTSCAFLLFTEVTNHGGTYGTRLKDYITTNHLGAVAATEQAVNPNSGNTLRAFLWTLDHKAIMAWVKKHPTKESARRGALSPTTNVMAPYNPPRGVAGGDVNLAQARG